MPEDPREMAPPADDVNFVGSGNPGWLARNLGWSWHPEVADLFRELDPVRFRQLDHNPIALLAEFTPERLEARAAELGTGPVPFGTERFLERNGQAVIVKKQVILTGENLTDAQRARCKHQPWIGRKLPDGTIVMELPPKPLPEQTPPQIHLSGSDQVHHDLESGPTGCPILQQAPCIDDIIHGRNSHPF